MEKFKRPTMIVIQMAIVISAAAAVAYSCKVFNDKSLIFRNI